MPTSTSDPETLAADLRAEARALGLTIGITRPDAIPEAAERLATFLAEGRHGQMTWMAERTGWRGNPAALWGEARTVIMLAETYAPGLNPLDLLDHKERGAISVYARNRDYHDVLKKKLKRLGRWLIAQAGGEIKVFVDTAPVMEKPLGAAAGLGWQGKHTNLVSRTEGNWFFLGALFTTLDLPTDGFARDGAQGGCGSCRACIDICPTGAITAPYQLDARRCISYLTIEHKGPVPEALRPLLGNRIYGCDDCLAICPWNKFAGLAQEAGYQARIELTAPRLGDLAALDEPGFRALFSKSPIKRIGHARFLRNVLYAIGNSGEITLRKAAWQHKNSESPEVADAARWALSRL